MTEPKFQKVVCARFQEADLPAEMWQQIEESAESVVRVADDESDAFTAELADADALLLKLGRPATAGIMDAAPELRYIGVFGTGYGSVDVEAATARDITVCNIADYATEGVAEFTVAVILAELRDFGRAVANAAQGDFDESSFEGRDLAALRVGVIGAGAIGSRVAHMIRDAFGSETMYWSRNRKDDLEGSGIAYAGLDDLLATSDVVSVHIESNPETVGFMDGDRLGLLRRGAIVVSTVPMDVFHYDALLQALQEKDLRLLWDHPDEMEPNRARELAALPGVTTYPPIAYTTRESSEGKFQKFVDSLTGYLKGSPVNKVN